MQQFFEYFLNNFRDFELNRRVCELARNVAFIRVGSSWRKPCDLFDPSDTILNDLLFSEGFFPGKVYSLHIPALKFLGLKRAEDVDCNIMLSVANTLHQWSSCNASRHDIERKASAFKNILQSRPDILHSRCSSRRTLCDSIQNLSCILLKQDRPSDFPDILPWNSEGKLLCTPTSCKVTEFQYIIGSTIPVVDFTNTVARCFQWDSSPNITAVIQQIEMCQHQFEQNPTNSYAFCAYIQKLYSHLSTRLGEVESQAAMLQGKRIVWTGQLFETPSKVLVNATRQELDFKPYLFKIPGEFAAFTRLFATMKCPERLTSELLLRVLSAIKDKTNSCDVPLTASQDTKVLLEVLKQLSAFKQNGDNNVTDNTLILIDDGSECIKLKPAASCILADDQDDIDSEEMANVFTVHKLVPEEIAVILGVRSVKKKTIHDASEDIDFQEWGQSEALTTRIHSLLAEGYKDGLSVPKELIQNADDAGATIVKFLYDERRNLDYRKKLLSSRLSECQGPALWVYNDSVFTERDMENIVKLNGGTKAECEDKIGKFGLGFCSVYNLTDVPSFVSRNDFVIFDPHETYLEEARRKRGAGLRLNLAKKNLIRRNVDQFKPFASVFGCTLTDPDFNGYEGTLFRLPLRTDEQAQNNLISNECYSKSEITELLRKFAENSGSILLFTQNVKTVQVFHLPADDRDPRNARILFEVCKEVTRIPATSSKVIESNIRVENVLTKMPSVLKTGKRFQDLHLVQVSLTFTDCVFLTLDIKEKIRTVTWIISWALGRRESFRLAEQKVSDRMVPLTSVAVPVQENRLLNLTNAGYGFYTEGHLFCFLPLPVTTGLKIHINGCFHVTSDRRNLVKLTEDDIRRSEGVTWNSSLMQDSLVYSFVHLLQHLSAQNNPDYLYYELWPLKADENAQLFKHSFVSVLFTEKPRLFKGIENWLSVEEIIFLDPNVRESIIGGLAFELLSKITFSHSKKIVEMPRQVLDALKTCEFGMAESLTSAMISEEDIVLFFLDSIDNKLWHRRDEERNRFVLYALNCKSKRIMEKLKTTKCIPSDPNGILCRPDEMIDPNAEIAKMFDTDEGVFPLATSAFSKEYVSKLVELGLRQDEVPHSVLLERCHTVKRLNNICNICALKRSLDILQYMSKWKHLNALEKDQDSLQQIKNIEFVPVMRCPKSWKFTWGANDVAGSSGGIYCSLHMPEKEKERSIFACPISVYEESNHMSAGSVCSFIDDSSIRSRCYSPENLYRVLAVKSELTVELILKQLMMLSEQYTTVEFQFLNLQKISRSAFESLGRLVQNKTLEEVMQIESLQNLKREKIVLIGKSFVAPENCAFSVAAECSPYFCKLQFTDINRKKVYLAMGVSEHFSLEYVLDLFRKAKTDDSFHNVEQASMLISNLCDYMRREKKCYEDLKDYFDIIVAPDTSGVLRPTYELVIEDPAFEASSHLHILHEMVPPALGKKIGVRSKQRKIVEGFSSKFYIPFGQNESLVTRLNGILQDYSCNSSIMKEMIQNADDAGATQIHFIKNYQTYPSDRRFCKPEIQGPALCIFNDSFFTDEDFDGIRHLGIGSKREDPSKTGQYGLGFNAVYHLTDSPSFLTKGPNLGCSGQMCIFDPLMTFLEEGLVTNENPGIKCDAEQLRLNFPEMLLGYPNADNMVQGTMFRLPLRSSPSDITDNVVTTEDMDRLIETFKEDMFDCLLFLKNLREIKVMSLQNGELKEEYFVTIEMSSDDASSRDDYYKMVKAVIEKNKEKQYLNLSMSPIESTYKMTVCDSQGLKKTWRITNRFGIKSIDETYKDVVDALKEKSIGLLPVASVAVSIPDENWNVLLLDNCKQRLAEKGKAFCFLPLPIETGMPVHVNCHFSLDRARTQLWKESVSKRWNEFVISELLSRAWIKALQYIAMNFITPKIMGACLNNKKLSDLMAVYHEFFPLMHAASNDSWRSLVEAFYRISVHEKVVIYPCITHENDKNEETQKFNIEWVPLSVTEQDYCGYFNLVCKSKLDRKECISVEKTMKKLGMKIIDTPKEIRKSMEECGKLFIPKCIPKTVLQFLKTFDIPGDNTCQLYGVGGLLVDTVIADVEALHCLLKYLLTEKLTEEFADEFEGLPLNLTADGRLRIFERDKPVFCSSMSEVLTGSLDEFIHPNLVFLIEKTELLQKGIIKHFTPDDLLLKLPQSFDPDLFASGRIEWKKKEKKPISVYKIKRIFEYIYFESLEFKTFTYSRILNVNHDLFQTRIKNMANWSFLPSIEVNGTNVAFYLIPIAETCSLFYSGEGNIEVSKALKKLNLPSLDTSTFDPRPSDVIYPVQKMLPSTERPSELLNCLDFNNKRLKSFLLTSEECQTILKYFSDHIEKLSDQPPDARSKLKRLPLFNSYLGARTHIMNKKDVYSLSANLPTEGIESWLGQTDIVLLKFEEGMKKLYEFISVKTVDVAELYANSILPEIDRLPKDAWLVHITFIKNNLLKTAPGKSLDDGQKKLVDILKTIPFVHVKDTFKRVDELHDFHNDVFKEMLDESEFLPEMFISDEWICFMKQLGLILEPTENMLMKFAIDISAYVNFPITEKIRRQSEAVVRCIFGKDMHPSFSRKLRTIRFVVPYKVDYDRRQVFQQPGNSKMLVSFEGSTSSTFADLCWSTSTLLSSVPFSDELKEALGILREPEVLKVVKHCQNVCHIFQQKLERQDIDYEFVFDVMERLYNFLQKHINPSMRTQFQVTPIVLLTEERSMVPVRKVVFNNEHNEDLKPFLFKLPSCFRTYIQLFESLGAEENVSCWHYASVLKDIHDMYEDSSIPANMLEIVRRVIERMILLLYLGVQDNSLSDVTHLFLPDKSKKLVDSAALTVSNNYEIEARIKDHCNIRLFLGFKELEIRVQDPALAFICLPERIRPAVLTDVVNEEILVSHLQMEESLFANRIEGFLRSPQLIEGMLRLVKHEKRKTGEKFENSLETHVMRALSNVHVKKVTGLKTQLQYQGTVIDQSERDAVCFVNAKKKIVDGEKTTVVKLFFQINEQSNLLTKLIDEQQGLTRVIDICTKDVLGKHTSRAANSILRLLDEPDDIRKKLDDLQIDAYNLPQAFELSVFPKPGTYVEPIFYQFLEQAFIRFKVHEYRFVALEIEEEVSVRYSRGAGHTEEDELSDQERVYIYAHILREVHKEGESDLLATYDIDVGDLYSINVPFDRLYRFKPRDPVEVSTLVMYDIEPVGSIPIDENFKRVRQLLIEAWSLQSDTQSRGRVIRRLKRRWHPDRNKENRDYAQRVFNYIDEVVLLLENGNEVENRITDNTGRTPVDMRNSGYRDICILTRERPVYAPPYYDYQRDDRESVVRHVGEAKRWIKQAERDFIAAQSNMTTGESDQSFNWVCYKCHQAAEKSLKAAWFAENANKAQRKDHSLTILSYNLDGGSFCEKCQKLEDIIGSYFSLRYPDAVYYSNTVPSEKFTEDKAKECLCVTKDIINMATELIA